MDFEQLDVCWVSASHVSIYLITEAASRTVFYKKKETLAQVFVSCEFCEISKNTFSYRTPLAAAFVILFQWKTQVLTNIRPSRLFKFSATYAAWKLSKYGIISGPGFHVFRPNAGKYETVITPYLDTFYAVIKSWTCFLWVTRSVSRASSSYVGPSLYRE